MMSAASAGLTNAGYLPASLAALLNVPLDRTAMTASPLGTLAVGSMYSYPPSASSSLALVPVDSTAAATAVLSPSAPPTMQYTPPPVPTPATFTTPPSPIPLVRDAAAASSAAPPAYAPPAVFSSGPLLEPFHFGHLIAVKLSPTNFMFWHAQVAPLLGSHYLMGYVDDTLPCPPVIVDSVNGPVYNLAHRVWVGQDQANLSSIQGSLTPEVAGMLVFAKTSHEAWTILERSFASQSQARCSALRRELGE
jgi:hypothetical protein